MLVHDRYAPHGSYESYDDEAEEDDDDDEKKNPQPSKELVDFLNLREKLKEKIRQKYKKENAMSLGSSRPSAKKDKMPSNSQFGSFFGPSQRVIASRVIEESKSIRESDRPLSRPQSVSAPAAKQPSSKLEGKPIPKSKPRPVIDEVQKKVQTLKKTRDYSFLLSDDPDLPCPAPAPSKKATSSAPCHSVLSSDHRHKQPQQQRLERSGKKPETTPMVVPADRRPHPRAEPRIAPPKAVGSAILTTKNPIWSSPASSKNPSSRDRAAGPSTSIAAPSQQRREPQARPKLPSSQASAPSSSKPRQEAQRMPGREVRKDEGRRREKPPAASPKKTVRPRNPFDDDDDDIDDPMSFLRNKLLSRYQASKYHDDDGDDSDMEANFDDIMAEERRSLKIAKREDEEQLRLIEEEEERERMRREAKRRKVLRR